MANLAKPNDQDSKAENEPSGSLTAKDIVAEFNTHWSYMMGTYYQRWHDAWNITNNHRILYGYEGTADTFIPLTFSIIESTKANVVGGRPKITYLPTNDEQTADSKLLDSTIDYVWGKGGYQARVVDWVDGALTYGSSFLMVTWDTELDMPVPRYVAVKDFWIHPSATTIEHAERDNMPCGYRYLTTKEALKARQLPNPDFDDSKPESKRNQRTVNMYDHAAVARATSITREQTDATDKNMWQGSTLGDDAPKHQVEVIVRYGNGKRIEVLNRSEIILDTEAEVDDMYPFAPLYDFKDPSLFYGRGHVDILKQRQEELNDVDNQDTDNMSAQLDSMKWVDPAYARDCERCWCGYPYPTEHDGRAPTPAIQPQGSREAHRDQRGHARGCGCRRDHPRRCLHTGEDGDRDQRGTTKRREAFRPDDSADGDWRVPATSKIDVQVSTEVCRQGNAGTCGWSKGCPLRKVVER